MPLRRHLLCASTPGSKLPSARRCNLSSSFRPRGFSPPRRFPPHTGPRACCIPQPARVRRVSGAIGAGPVPQRPKPSTERWRTSEPSSPRRGFTPFEECPRRQPVPASPRSVAVLSLSALIRPSPRPKPQRETVPANREPRGPRPGRSRISDPLAWAVLSSTVKLRSAANGGPPRHRGTREPANRRTACADRHHGQRRSATCERAVESRARRHACTAQGG
jgi:hypothetical protein